MSTWRFEYLREPFAVCLILLLTCGCQSVDRAGAQPAKSTKAAPSALSPHAKKDKKTEPEKDAPEIENRSATKSGACSKTDRAEHVHDANQKFIGTMRSCSKKTWANNAKNVACLSKAMPSLSKGCVNCFADMASCAVDNCKMACMMSSTGDKCTDCANSHCQASLIQCTGVARADLP